MNILPVTSFHTPCKMVRYSAEERTFIVQMYLNNPNPFGRCRHVHHSFYLRFNKVPPTERPITSLVHKLHNKHNLLDLNKAHSGRPHTVRTPGVIQQVEQSLKNNPHQSARRNTVGISESSFSRITQNDIRFYPNRLCFARAIHPEISNGTLDLQEVMWSDEAAFHLNGQVNTWNTRYYAERGNRLADFIQERGQNQANVQCWAALRNGDKFGIFFSMKTSIHVTTKL